MHSVHLAVLMTSHDRRRRALSTLRALVNLLCTARAGGPHTVVVGAVRDAYGDMVYSGRRGRALPLVEPAGHRAEPCHTYDGRVVLVSRAVYDLVGDPDKVFRHRTGDYDHGRRAHRAG